MDSKIRVYESMIQTERVPPGSNVVFMAESRIKHACLTHLNFECTVIKYTKQRKKTTQLEINLSSGNHWK
jgi:hypothetical protein